MTLINILTRTSGRPNFFYYNWLSVQKQTHRPIRHLISADDDETVKYLAPYTGIEVTRVNKLKRDGNDSFPYNLYLNELQGKVTEGWIMFLDDDDWFLSEDSLSQIVKHLKDPNEIVLWQVQFPNRLVPPTIPKSCPRVGHVSCIGFAFHSSQKGLAVWGDRKGGDYRIISTLYKSLRPRWIEQVLTGVNYRFNRTSGSGERIDLRCVGAKKKISVPEEMSESDRQMSAQTIVSLDKIAKRFLQSDKTETVEPVRKMTQVPANSLAEIQQQLENNMTACKLKKPKPVIVQKALTNFSDEVVFKPNTAPPKKERKLRKVGVPKSPISEPEPEQEPEKELEEEEPEQEPEQEPEKELEEEEPEQVSEEEQEQEASEKEMEEEEPEAEQASEKEPEQEPKESSPIAGQLRQITELLESGQKIYILTEKDLNALVERLTPNVVPPAPIIQTPVQQSGGMKWLSAKQQLNQNLEHGDKFERSVKSQDFQNVAPENGLKELIQGYQRPTRVQFTEPVAKNLSGSSAGSSMDLSGSRTGPRTDQSGSSAGSLQELFSQIYIIDQNSRADQLQKRLTKLGITSRVIRTTPASKKKGMGLFDYLSEVAGESQKKGLKSVLVMLDVVVPHVDLLNEIKAQWTAVNSLDWKVLYIGASQNLIREAPLDPVFYSQTYPDLHEAKIGQNSQLCTRHWSFYGKKEGRFGSRCVKTPDVTKGVSVIGLNASCFEEVARQKKAPVLAQYLSKNIGSKVFGVSPLWFLTEPGKYNKARTKHNLPLYK
jgi:hypothetical protein